MKALFSITIYGILSVLLLFGMFAGLISFDTNEANGFMILILTLIAVFGNVSTVVSLFSHLDDIKSVIGRKEEVVSAEHSLREMKEHVKMVTEHSGELDAQVMAKSNVDHPIVPAMRLVAIAESHLEDLKNSLSRSRARIAARDAGPFSWIVSAYGNGE